MDQPSFFQAKPAKEHSPAISDFPKSEQPAHRLVHFGAGSVSNTELLAILLGARYLKDAMELYTTCGGTLCELSKASVLELQQFAGVGQAGAARLLAAFELARRFMAEPAWDRPAIRCPADAANLLMPEMMLLEQETFVVVTFNTRNRVIGKHVIYVGSAHSILIRGSEIFRVAIKDGAVAIMLFHNHPSGEATPSPEDVTTTKGLVEAGKLLDIEVLDHIIIGHNCFVSLKEKGLGF